MDNWKKIRKMLGVLLLTFPVLYCLYYYDLSALLGNPPRHLHAEVIDIGVWDPEIENTDLVIRIKNDDKKRFYINRGLERLSIDSFRKHLLHKQIVLVYNPVRKRVIPIDTILLDKEVYYYKN